ncbi:hypothetical protein pdam_00008479, partial [Pocillopora damicornis]
HRPATPKKVPKGCYHAVAPTTGREVCSRLWPPLSTKTLNIMHRLLCTLLCMRIDKDTTPRHPISGNERLPDNTNQQISCCQTTIQEFGRPMEGRYLVKGSKDEKVPQKCHW